MSSLVRRPVSALILIGALLAQAGCFLDDEGQWAGRAQIVDAAARCGLEGFKPTKAGDEIGRAHV